MRARFDSPEGFGPPRSLTSPAPTPENLREASAVAELFLGVFRRDVLNFFPHAHFEAAAAGPSAAEVVAGPRFAANEHAEGALEVSLFGQVHRVAPRTGAEFSPQDVRMVRAIGAVASLRYHHLFQNYNSARLELYRGGSEDHYVAAFIDPDAYDPPAARRSRIASTILTLRTAALSTYENRRVSTGALLLGPASEGDAPARATPPDALEYGVELTGLKSVHRLCDGKRTLFLVDPEGKLAGIVDVARFAAELTGDGGPDVPCARSYQAHARATRSGGHVCLVLSPNQEIKIFASGSQAFGFAHGRWRILDPGSKYAHWLAAVDSPALARAIFQAALNLAEARQGALFVVAADPCTAVGPLLSPHDLVAAEAAGPPAELAPRDPLAKRALHYLARGQDVMNLDPAVLEALASLDGALVADRSGRLLAFGAILRHDVSTSLTEAEGARTTAALIASRYGPVLKVSEDGIVSCFLDGERAWDL